MKSFAIWKPSQAVITELGIHALNAATNGVVVEVVGPLNVVTDSGIQRDLFSEYVIIQAAGETLVVAKRTLT